MKPGKPSVLPAGAVLPPEQRVSDADFRLMVDAIADYAIFLLDPEGRVRTWNTGAQRFKGYEPEEIIGQHIRVFYPPEVAGNGWPEHELDVARIEGRFEDEGWRVRKDGKRFWANVVITRLVNAQGQLRGFSKVTRDLTERRGHEEMLRNSEERFRLLVDGVRDYAIFLLDPDGRIASWNAGAQRTKGYLPEEILGQHFSVFYPPELIASGWPAEELRRALADGRYEEEGWRLRKDGSRFWASVVITALTDPRGKHIGFAKVTRDLTDKRRIRSLEDEGRRITDFLALLGHELRNPLAPIANALAIMEVADPASPHVDTARAVISRQVTQLTRLVDDLLDVGRITSGKIHLERKPVRLAAVLADAVEAVDSQARAKGQRLTLGEIDSALWVHADRARILQVAGNLLTNAIKFTPDGGEIVVGLARNGDQVEFSVRDTGIGIPEHLLQDIFKPFVQVEADQARSQGGLGLGLSLVQQVVALHGGHVAAYSKGGRGDGSEFVVSLPIGAAAAAAADEPRVSPPGEPKASPPTGHAVLVVDDNQDAAETLRMVLEALGYRARVEHDGLAGLEAILRDRPDAVLLDLGLPGLGGLELAQRLRAQSGPQPRLIAVTGYGTDEDRAATARAGFDAHLSKPASIAELTRLLGHLLG